MAGLLPTDPHGRTPVTSRRHDTNSVPTAIRSDEVSLYYGMIWRGLPAGLVAFAILAMPPYPPVRWVPTILAIAVFVALVLTIIVGDRGAVRRRAMYRELVLQNLLANTATALAMWAAGHGQGSLVPLLFVILIYNSAFRIRTLMLFAWAAGTTTHLVGSLLGGETVAVAVTSTIVFAGAAAAAQLSVGYVVGRLRALATDVGLEREVAGYAARTIDRDQAFQLMLTRAAELLKVRRLAVVATRDGEHRVVASVRDGSPETVFPAELDLGGAARIGAADDDETLRLCAGVGEGPDPSALAAVRDLFMLVVERARHLSGLHTLANSDGLTGLGNRRYLDARFDEMTADATSCAVVIIDLDHFKELNDTQGHLAGDDVLVSVAQLIRSVARTGDVAARYGGEEFCILIPHANEDEAASLEGRLREAWSASDIPVGFSAGIAASHPGEPIASVLARADNALYEAKATGRGRAVRAS
jgi:diguanylate cyclase (GGDEF)-like protein